MSKTVDASYDLLIDMETDPDNDGLVYELLPNGDVKLVKGEPEEPAPRQPKRPRPRIRRLPGVH